ncbi:MAG: proton-translocating transhydrogenase family protein, partial [Rhodospirillales bacterium]
MDPATLADHSAKLATEAQRLAEQAATIANEAAQITIQASGAAVSGQFSFLSLFSIFVMACFVGFYVVWSVTPALHSPLMSVTNAISSVIIVGGLLAA